MLESSVFFTVRSNKEHLKWNKREYLNSYQLSMFCSAGQSANTGSEKPLADYEVNGEVWCLEVHMQDTL